VRAVVAAADAEGLVDLGARTLSALNPSAVSLASSSFPGTPHAAITLLDCVLGDFGYVGANHVPEEKRRQRHDGQTPPSMTTNAS
jgi:hypothetical protein